MKRDIEDIEGHDDVHLCDVCVVVLFYFLLSETDQMIVFW